MIPITKARRIDDLGRLVIPKDIRNQLNINANDLIKIELRKSGELLLSKEKEPDYKIVKTLDGLEELQDKKGNILIIKNKITPLDIANILGVSLSVEQE